MKVRGRALDGGTSMCKGPGAVWSLAGEPVSCRRLAWFCLLSRWVGASPSPLRALVQPSQRDLEFPDTSAHHSVTCPLPTLFRMWAVRSDG